MHLTNYAINKGSENFNWDERYDHGSKRTLAAVMDTLSDCGLNTERLWNRISDVVLKTIITIQPQVRKTLNACFRSDEDLKSLELGCQCFEILGFDIFIDQKLKPWLLEVNHSPSFTCDSNLDTEIKEGVISDTLRLVSLEPNLEKKYRKEQKEKSKQRLLKRTVASAGVKKPSPTLSPEPDNELNAGLLLQNIDCKIAPAAENPIKTIKEAKATSTGKLTGLDEETASRLLSSYYQAYPEGKLEEITARENRRGLGDFQRIFPPSDQNKLAQYLKCIETAEEFFGETVASKKRKEFIQQKKQQEIDRRRVSLEIKEKNEKRTNRAFTIKKQQRLLLGREKIPERYSFSGLRIVDGNTTSQHRPLRSAYRSPRQRSKTTSSSTVNESRDLKESIKLNVESINDRFMNSLLQQKGNYPFKKKVSDVSSSFHVNIPNPMLKLRLQKKKRNLTPIKKDKISAKEFQEFKAKIFSYEF